MKHEVQPRFLLLPSWLLPAHEYLEVILGLGGRRKFNSPVAICTDIQELLAFVGLNLGRVWRDLCRECQRRDSKEREWGVASGSCSGGGRPASWLEGFACDPHVRSLTLSSLCQQVPCWIYFLCLAVHRLAPKSKLIHAYNMEDLGVCHFNGQEYT